MWRTNTSPPRDQPKLREHKPSIQSEALKPNPGSMARLPHMRKPHQESGVYSAAPAKPVTMAERSDKDILLCFKTELAENALSSWNVTASVRSWYGVTAVGDMVTVLSLPYQLLMGSLPCEWGALTALRELSLGDNRLSGPLPREWSTMMALQSLKLHNNHLSGSLPSEWSALTALQSLELQGNQLSGPLPREWSALTALRLLQLHGNQLSGPLPCEWSALTALRSLQLHGNQLSGPLPCEWSALMTLQFLELQDNQLSGLLPREWSTLTALQLLELQGNQLSELLPLEWSTLAPLQPLKLQGTQVPGPLLRKWSPSTGQQGAEQLEPGNQEAAVQLERPGAAAVKQSELEKPATAGQLQSPGAAAVKQSELEKPATAGQLQSPAMVAQPEMKAVVDPEQQVQWELRCWLQDADELRVAGVPEELESSAWKFIHEHEPNVHVLLRIPGLICLAKTGTLLCMNYLPGDDSDDNANSSRKCGWADSPDSEEEEDAPVGLPGDSSLPEWGIEEMAFDAEEPGGSPPGTSSSMECAGQCSEGIDGSDEADNAAVLLQGDLLFAGYGNVVVADGEASADSVGPHMQSLDHKKNSLNHNMSKEMTAGGSQQQGGNKNGGRDSNDTNQQENGTSRQRGQDNQPENGKRQQKGQDNQPGGGNEEVGNGDGSDGNAVMSDGKSESKPSICTACNKPGGEQLCVRMYNNERKEVHDRAGKFEISWPNLHGQPKASLQFKWCRHGDHVHVQIPKVSAWLDKDQGLKHPVWQTPYIAVISALTLKVTVEGKKPFMHPAYGTKPREASLALLYPSATTVTCVQEPAATRPKFTLPHDVEQAVNASVTASNAPVVTVGGARTSKSQRTPFSSAGDVLTVQKWICREETNTWRLTLERQMREAVALQKHKSELQYLTHNPGDDMEQAIQLQADVKDMSGKMQCVVEVLLELIGLHPSCWEHDELVLLKCLELKQEGNKQQPKATLYFRGECKP